MAPFFNKNFAKILQKKCKINLIDEFACQGKNNFK